MAGQRTLVEVLSLEDFHRTLAARLTEAETALRKLDNELGGRPPALGTFADAEAHAAHYRYLQQGHADRVRRLRAALLAAQQATQTIITNYRTTEARNRANASDIAGVLGGVSAALSPSGDSGA